MLANRGFNISDDLAVDGASIAIPSFIRGNPSFPNEKQAAL